MIVGVPKEIKDGELRVALTPVGAETMVSRGHEVLIETEAGSAAGMDDAEYVRAGARILPAMDEVYAQSEMVMKVKEILPPEYPLLREDQIVFTYIHSAIRPEQTQMLLDRKVIGIAYENVTPDGREFPLLTPMSEIAGEVGLLLGAYQMFAVKWVPGLTIVSRDMLKLMKRSALILDIDCEPNGAVETCRFSTHADPVYEVDGIRHVCVPNLPSAAARTASFALCNATLPFALELADKGWFKAVTDNAALRKGMSFAKGYLTFLPTAEAQGRPYTTPEAALSKLR